MRKNLSVFTVFALFIALFFASCGGSSTPKTETQEETKPETTEQVTETVKTELDFSAGEKIYNDKCIVCHMADGKGVEGNFPPLAGSDYLLADKKRAVAQVLNGSNEEMLVNGHTYNIPMTPQVDNYEDAVAVINYVLNSFGNDGGTIALEEVQDIEIIR